MTTVSTASKAAKTSQFLGPQFLRACLRRLLAALGAVAVVLGLIPSTAGAHSVDQALVYLDVTDQAMGGRVEYPVIVLRQVFGLSLEGQGDELLDEIRPVLPEIQAYALDHIAISVNGVDQEIEFEGLSLLAEVDADQTKNFVQIYFSVVGLKGDIPRVFDLTFDPFFDELEGRSALLLVANDIETGVFENGEEVLLGFDPDNRTRTVDLGRGSNFKNFVASVKLGIDHIKTGPDHVLFILVLLLPSVLAFTGKRWLPQQSFGSSLWRVLKIATMFTIAHSITFSLAGLELLPLPPSKVVEAIIAVSIAMAALHNIKPIFPNKEWLIAFAFGLFHGMGFASLVQGLDISKKTQLVSLLGRNVGIEIGQAGVVLGGFTALFLLSRTRWYLPLFTAASVAMALISAGWMVERIAEVDLGINGFVEPLLQLPLALYLLISGTAMAAAVYGFEKRRGRLLSIGSAFPDSGDLAGLEQAEQTKLRI